MKFLTLMYPTWQTSLVVLSAKLKVSLGHLCVMLTVQGFIPISAYYLDSIIILSDYYLCLPSLIQFLVTLVIRWRIYCLPHHNMVSHQHFLKTKTWSFDDGTLGFTFIIGEFLCFSFQLSPIDWKSVESFPCCISIHLFTWPGLYWFLCILTKTLGSHL